MPTDGRSTSIIPVRGMRLRKLDSSIPPNTWFKSNPRAVSNWTDVYPGDVLEVVGIDPKYDVTPFMEPVMDKKGFIDPAWLAKSNNRLKITCRVVRLKSTTGPEARKQIYILPLNWCTTEHLATV